VSPRRSSLHDDKRARSAPVSCAAIDPGIFKAYDVRGLYGEQIDADVAYRVARAFVRVLADEEGKQPGDLRIGLGHDMRLTAPELAARYSEGMRDEGASVVEVGQVGTEMLYFTVGSRDLDGGLMCTASHNPKSYTGAKLVKRGAIALSGDSGIGEVARIVADGPPGPPAEPRGEVEKVDIATDFQEAAMAFIDPSNVRAARVVLDGGNGMAGPMVGPLLDRLPIEQVQTYWTPDGHFPDHEPNPLLPENRTFIVKKVLSEGAELGIAWDGDADRCFFIDDNGQFVDGDFLTALMAESVLSKQPGATILYDVRASRAVADVVERAGGTALKNRVGHAFFKTRMHATGAVFGGEVSGHYYFHDFYNADSGTIPALLILELLSLKGKRMCELLAPLRERYFISGEINSEVADQEAKMREIEERYSDGKIEKLDGVSIDYPDWHFNVRPSNTEPLLRLNLESVASPDHMEEKRDEVLALIRS
jgi:phosphomannomutase